MLNSLKLKNKIVHHLKKDLAKLSNWSTLRVYLIKTLKLTKSNSVKRKEEKIQNELIMPYACINNY